MSILKVANVHFDSTGTNRLDYVGGDNIVRVTSNALKLPVGDTASRPTGEAGLIRYNSQLGTFEGRGASDWSPLGVTSFASNVVISVADNTNAALRITQTGTADAIRVEDETNPDSSPFVVTANGDVGIGTVNALAYGANYTTLTLGGERNGDFALKYANNRQGLDLYVSKGARPGIDLQGMYFYDSAEIQTWTIDFNGSEEPEGLRLITYNANNSITFRPNNTERVRFATSGNVLIGRINSTVGLGVKLDVAGAINCSNIFVNGSPVTGGGGSVTITDQTSTTTTQYITFTTSTTGTASSINVASTKLTFNAASGTLSSTVFNATSDINKKTDIEPVKDALDILNQIDGVRFTWKDNMTPSLGVIAQTVEKVLPELVDDGKSVNYNGLIAVLIEAIKELKAEIDILKAKS